MKKGVFIALIVLAAVVLCSAYAIGSYNSIRSELYKLEPDRDNVVSKISYRNNTALDLISYMEEKNIISKEQTDAASMAISNMGKEQGIDELGKYSGELSGIVTELLKKAEESGEDASPNFLSISEQIRDEEEILGLLISQYNKSAKIYNSYIKSFPVFFAARMYGFEVKPLISSGANMQSTTINYR